MHLISVMNAKARIVTIQAETSATVTPGFPANRANQTHAQK